MFRAEQSGLGSSGAEHRSLPIIAPLVEQGRKLEFVAKIGLVEEEADESAFWMELIIESGMLREKVGALLLEA